MNTNVELKVVAINNLLKDRNADFAIETKKMFKPNGELDAFILSSEKYNFCPTIYPSEDMLQKSVEEIATELQSLFKLHARNYDVANLLTSDYVLDNVLPRMVSVSNLEMLKEHHIPYIPYLDLLIYFYVPLSEFPVGEDMGIGNMQVSHYLLQKIEKSLDEIFQASLHNLDNSYQIKNMCQMMSELGVPGLDEDVLESNPVPIWLITNKDGIYGASGILSKKALSEIKNIFGNRFLILPSSIHEVICVPYKDELSDVLHMVTEINAGVVKQEDFLSNNIYIYENESLRQFVL